MFWLILSAQNASADVIWTICVERLSSAIINTVNYRTINKRHTLSVPLTPGQISKKSEGEPKLSPAFTDTDDTL